MTRLWEAGQTGEDLYPGTDLSATKKGQSPRKEARGGNKERQGDIFRETEKERKSGSQTERQEGDGENEWE